MRISRNALFVFRLASLAATTFVLAQEQPPQFPRILSARTVYFDNRTGSDRVGEKGLAQLKKYGKFHLVTNPKKADLILLLSADPYRGGHILVSGGQTGTVESNGHIEEDPIPNYNKQSPARYAYLTVIDAKTAESLWSDKRLWGGLLTGFNSVGERLVGELEKQLSEVRGVSGLRAVKATPPAYPEEAREKHIQGKVVLNVVVDKDGAIAEVNVLSGAAELVQSAIDSVRQFQFGPPQQAPVSTNVEIWYGDGPCPAGEKPERREVLHGEKLPLKSERRGALRIVDNVNQLLPNYPVEAMDAGIEGELVISITVDPTGDVVGARVVKSLDPALDAASLDTVKTWKFKVTKGEQAQFPMKLIFQLTCSDSVGVRIF